MEQVESFVSEQQPKESSKVWPAVTGGLLVACFVGIGIWLYFQPTPAQRTIKTAEMYAAPWDRYQILMDGYGTGFLSSDDSLFSEDENELKHRASAALTEALKANTPSAINYVCKENINGQGMRHFQKDYCTTLSVDLIGYLLFDAQTDAKNQGLPSPTEVTVGELARKHGGTYTPRFWDFPSVAERKLFEHELSPYRN